MDQVALGKRIKAARERVGMTQEDLAAAVDYSVDHVSVVEPVSYTHLVTMTLLPGFRPGIRISPCSSVRKMPLASPISVPSA